MPTYLVLDHNVLITNLSLCSPFYFWFKYELNRSTTHSKFDPTGVRTWPPDHDSTFYVTEMIALTTQPSMSEKNVLPYYLRGLRRLQMHRLSDSLMHLQLIILVQVRLRQKYYAQQVRLDQGLNSWPPDHNSTFYIPETPALTTRSSVTVFTQDSGSGMHSTEFPKIKLERDILMVIIHSKFHENPFIAFLVTLIIDRET